MKALKSRALFILWLLALASASPKLPAATAAPSPIAKAPSPTPAPKLEKHAVLLMTAQIGTRFILSCSNPDGSCRRFLSESEGFQSVLPATNKGNDFAGVSSPDGKWIAFYSDRNGAVNLWIADAYGLNQRSLTESDSSIIDPSPSELSPIQFSPDSRQIAFLQNGNIWICELSGENAEALTQDGHISGFAWFPDGSKVAYLHYGSIRTVAASGTSDELLKDEACNYPTMAFAPVVNATPQLFYFYNGLWQLDVSTKHRSKIYGNFVTPNKVSVSPAGDSVAMLSYSPEGRIELFLVSVGSTHDATQLTSGGAAWPCFSSDGKSIYFERSGSLWSVSAKGSNASQIYAGAYSMLAPGQLEYTAAKGACP